MKIQDTVLAEALPESLLAQLRSHLFAGREEIRAYVHSFGCQLNVSDGERIRGMLREIGFTLTEKREEADLILLNTCAVRESAEDHVYGILGNIKHEKVRNPDLILVLCGCMASEEQTSEYVRKHYPFVDIVFGTHRSAASRSCCWIIWRREVRLRYRRVRCHVRGYCAVTGTPV